MVLLDKTFQPLAHSVQHASPTTLHAHCRCVDMHVNHKSAFRILPITQQFHDNITLRFIYVLYKLVCRDAETFGTLRILNMCTR